ncbi:hypothetical protein V6N13_059248 [Hibiscus sabdariffa]
MILQKLACYCTSIGTGFKAGQSFYRFRNNMFLGEVESCVEAMAMILQKQQNWDLSFQADGFNIFTLGLGDDFAPEFFILAFLTLLSIPEKERA